MRQIEQSLEALQPIAVNNAAPRQHILVRQAGEFEIGKARRIILVLAEIDPDEAAGFTHRMRSHGHFFGKGFAALDRLGRCIDAFAIDAHLPTVEDASEAVALITRQRHRSAAVRTALGDKTDAAVGRTEGNEILAEQAHALRRAIGFELGRTAGRNPIFTKHVTHRRAGTDTCQKLILFPVEHDLSPRFEMLSSSAVPRRMCNA